SHAILPSPGLLPKHYAPKTAVELFESRAAIEERFARRRTDERLGRLLIGVGDSDDANQLVLPAEPRLYSAGLYAALHSLDARGLTRILVEMPPDLPEWMAVRDRLSRAAAG